MNNQKTHHLKSWTYLFQAIKSGLKLHDLREKSKGIKIGDILILNEFDHTKGQYTGDKLKALVTYITSNNTPCAFSSAVLDNDYVILSLRVIEIEDNESHDEEIPLPYDGYNIKGY